MADCVFCKIIDGEIPARMIYESEDAVAFLDLSPWQTGHSLVIPRRHVADVLEDDTVLETLAPTVVEVAKLLKSKLGATACNIISNAGKDSGQEVFHAHVHVVPRYPDQPGLKHLRDGSEVDLDEVHAKLS